MTFRHGDAKGARSLAIVVRLWTVFLGLYMSWWRTSSWPIVNSVLYEYYWSSRQSTSIQTVNRSKLHIYMSTTALLQHQSKHPRWKSSENGADWSGKSSPFIWRFRLGSQLETLGTIFSTSTIITNTMPQKPSNETDPSPRPHPRDPCKWTKISISCNLCKL